MKLNDAVLGILFAALGGLVLFAIQDFPRIPGQPVGPALFPRLLACGLCIAGVLLVASGWRQRTSEPWLAWEPWVRSPRHVLALAVLLASVVLYIVAAERIGFLPLAFAILAALFTALRVPPRRALLLALVATLVVHFAFYKLLRVPLPWGVLTPWAW